MKQSGGLAQLAILVWLSWLALLGLTFGMLRWNAWHPHFLPVTSVLVAMLSAALALLITAGWRLMAGSRRANAMRWLLLGLPSVALKETEETWHSATAYDMHEGVPVVSEVRVEARGPGSNHREEIWRVTDSRFEPVPDSDYSAEHLLAGASERHLPP